MGSETLFRVVFIVALASLAVTWLANSLAVGLSRETLYSAEEGRTIAIARTMLLAASILGALLYAVDPGAMAWGQLSLPGWLRWLGAGLAAPALFLFAAVLRALGRNFSTTLTISPEQTLVTSGPYRWVRHPMYSAFVLLWIAFFLLSANVFVAVTGLTAYALVMALRTPREERMMIRRFGDEYRAYMERTGRFLPRLPFSG
jgi:protein-S-isoprenylcysteine O-methyltransferase Ste14